jgi:hypothetical protein
MTLPRHVPTTGSDRRRLGAWLCALALALATPVLSAQPSPGPTKAQKETARNLMQIGDEKLAAGDLRGALEAYRGADDIMQVPTTSLAVGRSCARLGMLVEAVDYLQRATRYPKPADEADAQKRAREEAAKLDAEVARRIPTVVVTVQGPAAATPVDLFIDGSKIDVAAVKLPQRLNPGSHVARASAAGYRESETSFEVAEREEKTVAIQLLPGPPAPPTPSAPATPEPSAPPIVEPQEQAPPVASIVAFSIGGAAILAGAVTGGLSLAKAADVTDRCTDGRCPAEAEGDHESAIALANASNVAFAIGGVGVAVGIVTLVLHLGGSDDGESAARSSVRPLIGFGSGGVEGSF